MNKKSIINIYQKFLLDLEEHDIRYAILRDDISIDFHIKDLDILVDYKIMNKFHHIAKNNGFFLIKDGHFNPGKKVYLKIEDERSFFLDVHERVIYRGIEFMDRNKLLNRRFRENDFYRLSNEDFVLCLLFHNVLSKRKIQEKHYEAIFQLLKNKLDKNYIRKHMRKFGLYTTFQKLVENFSTTYNNQEFINNIYHKAVFSLILRRPSNLARVISIYVRKYTVKLWGKRRGVLVTFIGPDGSGKSTTIKAVHQRLREIGFSCSTVYLGPWGQSVFQFRKIFRCLNLDPYREDYKAFYTGELNSKPGPLRGLKKVKLQVRSALYYILVVIEMWARWWGRVLPKLRRGEVVLADRYIYDMLTGYKSLPMDYHIGVRERVCNLFPRPDIGILLESDPEVIIARKEQLTRMQLIHAIASYREIAQKYNFKILDTSRDVKATLRDFEENILPEVLVRINMRKIHLDR